MYGLVPASAVALSPSLTMVAMLKSVRCACPVSREDPTSVPRTGGASRAQGCPLPTPASQPPLTSLVQQDVVGLDVSAESGAMSPGILPAPAPRPLPKDPHPGTGPRGLGRSPPRPRAELSLWGPPAAPPAETDRQRPAQDRSGPSPRSPACAQRWDGPARAPLAGLRALSQWLAPESCPGDRIPRDRHAEITSVWPGDSAPCSSVLLCSFT